jgi:uncharacterized membrane protein
MNAKAKVTLDRRYYSECYADWLRNVSKWRRYQILVGLILVTIATLLVSFSAIHGLIPAMIAVIGVFEIGGYLLNRHQWMSDRMADKRLDDTASLEFLEERIIHSGPFSRGEFLWDGIESMTATPKGLFLRPQRGISIYIPDRAWETPDAKQLVVNRFTQNAEQDGGGNSAAP